MDLREKRKLSDTINKANKIKQTQEHTQILSWVGEKVLSLEGENEEKNSSKT